MPNIDFKKTSSTESWIASITDKLSYRRASIPKTHYQKYDILINNPDFIIEISNLRREFGIPEKGFLSADDFEKFARLLWAKHRLINRYKKSIDNLLRKYNATNRWKPAIEYFLFFNNKKTGHHLPPAFDIIMMKEIGEPDGLYIRLTKETGLEDIKNNWGVIKLYQNLLNPFNEKNKLINNDLILTYDGKKLKQISPSKVKRKDLIKNFALYQNIDKLRKENMSYKEIAKKIWGNYSDDVKVGTYLSAMKNIFRNNKLF